MELMNALYLLRPAPNERNYGERRINAKASRRKRMRRIRAAHGGTIPKQYR